jgi:outer membrane lipoprotein-sorting protein
MKNRPFLPLFIIVVLVTGCSSIRDMVAENTDAPSNVSNSAPGTATEVDVGEATFAPSGDPKADIERMSDSFLKLDSFRAEMTGTGDTNMKAEMDFEAPDRFRMSSNIPGTPSSEIIVIGKATYLKAGGKWQKMDLDMGSSLPNLRESFSKEGMKWFKTIQFEGEDTAEGKPAYRYSYTGKAPGNPSEYSSTIWVERSTGLPIKVNADYESGSLKSMIIIYDYSTEIKIEPPIGK